MNASLRVLTLGMGAALLVGGVAAAGPPKSATATVDTSKVAVTIVTESAGIRPGELVLIEGGTRDQKLLEDIAVEVRKLGAHPLIALGSDRLSRMMIVEVPEQFDGQEPMFWAKIAEIADVVISVDFTEKPDNLADVSATRRAKRAAAYKKVYDKMLDRGVVRVHLGNDLYPTMTLAEQFDVPYDELTDIFWQAVNTDYNQVQVIGANVKNAISKGKMMHITAPNGTDLTVEIGNRPIYVSDGIVSSEDRYARGPACQVWLPAGEVYLTPKPKTAEGTFVAEPFYHQGKLIKGLTLTFKKGQLTSMKAESDIRALKEVYDAAPKERDWFGAIDIGINPAVMTPPGSDMVTWIGAGTISVGIGGNTWAGGNNDVPYGLYGHLLNGTLTVDGKKIVENGKLLVK